MKRIRERIRFLEWTKHAVAVWAVCCFLNTAIRADDETVTADEVPAAVKAALELHLPGFVPDEIELEDEDGMIVYEFEGLHDGRELEIEISAAGEVLELEVEEEDAEDEEEDEDEDEENEDEEEEEHEEDEGESGGDGADPGAESPSEEETPEVLGVEGEVLPPQEEKIADELDNSEGVDGSEDDAEQEEEDKHDDDGTDGQEDGEADRNETEVEIGLDSLPHAVLDALSGVAPDDFELREVELVAREEMSYYEVEGETADGEVEIKIAADGTVLKVETETEDDEDEDDGDVTEGDEDEHLSPSELPDAVLAAVEASVSGLEISEIEREHSNDRVFYEIEGLQDGKEIELRIAEDGTVLEIEIDSDGDELGDSDEAEAGSDPNDPDTDGDSFPDGFESTNGADPTNENSTPEVLELRVDAGVAMREVVLSMATFEGKTFTLEHCPDGRSWNESGIAIQGDGKVHEIRIVATDGEDCGFFRVRIHD